MKDEEHDCKEDDCQSFLGAVSMRGPFRKELLVASLL